MQAKGRHLEITPLTLESLLLLENIEKRCSRVPWSEKLFREEFGCNGSTVFGAKENGELVGFLVLRQEGNEAHVLNLGVLPDSRRMGIGKALVEWALGAAHQAGAREIQLEVRESNFGALALYESCEFVRVGTRPAYYSDTGEDAILMTKVLSGV